MQRLFALLITLAVLCSPLLTTAIAAENEFLCSTVSEIPQLECEALVALYNSANGDAWKDHTNWLLTNTPSDWTGIIVSDGHITELDLSNNQLSGTIPAELENLSQLEVLALLWNQLTGPIPAELGNLSNLQELWLDYNQLTGDIPLSLTNLEYLQNLTLQGNQLTGNIPPGIGSMWRLFQLGLGGNQLTGSIPPELGNLVNLTYLSLGNNQLTGSIPPELGNLQIRLYSLSLGGNQLSGNIPAELGNLSNLAILLLGNNQLTGSIPPELGNLDLECLRLDRNQLTGDIPASLSNLVNLMDPGKFYDNGDGLNLDYNHLNIPADYPNLADPLQALLHQKDPDWHLRQAFDQTIGIDGGTLTSLDQNVVVDIPATALINDTHFTFIPQPEPDNPAGLFDFYGNSFQLTAEDTNSSPVTTFGLPLTVTIRYTDEELGGVLEPTIRLFYWDDGTTGWVDAATTCDPPVEYVRDLEANTLSVNICHLSEFAVFGESQKLYLPLVIQ